MDSGETGIIMKSVNCTRKWSQPRYQIENTPVGGSCDGDGGGKGAQESTARINTREKTSWNDQRERLDTVDRDAKRMLKCRNWRRLAENRDAWRRRIEGTKAQFGL